MIKILSQLEFAEVAVISLAPSFSWVKSDVRNVEPFQRFSFSRRKLLNPGFRLRAVAQISNLLYRGFPTRWMFAGSTRVRMACRLEIGDTAGWKPALQSELHSAND